MTDTGLQQALIPLTLALREATTADHERAEHSPFQRQMVAGKLTNALYGAWLQQMRILHDALERKMGGLPDRQAQVRELVDGRRKVPMLDADLQFLDIPVTADPLPAMTGLTGKISGWAETDPIGLCGVLYVLEGSTNGARFIFRNVRRAAGFSGADGTRYLDPYGEEQPIRWQEFKVALDDLPVTAEDHAAAIAAARETFSAIAELGDQLLGERREVRSEK